MQSIDDTGDERASSHPAIVVNNLLQEVGSLKSEVCDLLARVKSLELQVEEYHDQQGQASPVITSTTKQGGIPYSHIATSDVAYDSSSSSSFVNLRLKEEEIHEQPQSPKEQNLKTIAHLDEEEAENFINEFKYINDDNGVEEEKCNITDGTTIQPTTGIITKATTNENKRQNYRNSRNDRKRSSRSLRSEHMNGWFYSFRSALSLDIITNPFLRHARRFEMKQNCTEISNTETLHMYSIAALADALLTQDADHNDTTVTNTLSRKRTNARIFAVISLLVICLQMLVLYFISEELTASTCAVNTDCNIGYYCHPWEDMYFSQPRCIECTNLQLRDNYTSLSECPEYFQDDSIWRTEEIDQNLLWYSQDFTPHYDSELAMNFTENEIVACLSLRYCEDTSLADGGPNQYVDAHFTLYDNRFSPDKIITFLFIAILFGNKVSEELKEIVKEDATLKIVIEQAKLIGSRTMPFVVKILRLSLRLREVVLPILTGIATITVLTNDTLSAKNIVLNFLALSYLLEADNILYSLFLSEKQRTLSDRIIFKDETFSAIQMQGVSFKVSLMWPTYFGIFLSVLTVVLLYSLTRLMEMAKFENASVFISMIQHYMVTFNMLGYALRQSMPWIFSWNTLHVYLLSLTDGLIACQFYGVVYSIGLAIVFTKSYWIQYAFPLCLISLVAIVVLLGIEFGIESFQRCSANRRCRSALFVCLIFLLAYVSYFLSYLTRNSITLSHI